MACREFIGGPNFSGRSGAVRARAQRLDVPVHYIGPYAEAALSGLSSTIADEIEIYRARSASDRPPFVTQAADLPRKPQSLSGGEQVLLALQCFSLSAFKALAIDTALEQLDASNRSRALEYLACADGFDAVLTDNRGCAPGWNCTELKVSDPTYACDWERLRAAIIPVAAPAIAIRRLSFAYLRRQQIFSNAEVVLEPGRVHRLFGPNGAGKTTLLKILVGALVPQACEMTLGGAPYEPWRGGNRALALATQNPDQQWCGATLDEDIARRRAALADRGEKKALDATRVATLARALGVASVDQHLYELPLAARKRISWLWPFAGAHPWLMLDEPTIGQDDSTSHELARTLEHLCAAGYGIVFVSHDEAFAARIPHRMLHVEGKEIS